MRRIVHALMVAAVVLAPTGAAAQLTPIEEEQCREYNWRRGSEAFSRLTTEQQMRRAIEDANGMGVKCANVGGLPKRMREMLGPGPRRSTGPVPAQEADRQLKGVLEREGQPGAKCQQKQYGSGWVTVCE